MRRGLTTLSLLLALSGTASAQNALGDGTKNDASIQRGAGRVNTPTNNDLRDSFALRNSVVTGNAPGGMSFRGNVGYVGAREFRGELGSDDLFGFRRDSIYSGISGLGLRGTDSLQYQFTMTTGSRPPSSIAGSLVISRDAFMPSVSAVSTRLPGTSLSDTSGQIRRVDPAEQTNLSGAGLWRLRSASGYITDKSLSTSYIGSIGGGENATYDVTASPLAGLRLIDPVAVSAAAAALRDSSTANTSGRVDPQSPENSGARATAVETGYVQILNQLRPGYSESTDSELTDRQLYINHILDQNAKIRAYIEGIRSEIESQQLDELEPEANGADQPTDDENLTANEQLIRDLEQLNIDPAVIETLRNSSVMVEDLVEGVDPADRNYYAVHMSQGRQSMLEGNYFNAEARFSMALSIRNGDPTAGIARVHAQIGAGLIVSAGTNLRETLTNNPTMITAKYAAGILPPEERIKEITPRLSTLASGAGIQARQTALVLAYIGYQTGNDDLVVEGLDRLELEGEDRLGKLLRLMWINDTQETDDGSE